jgi:hypothetical protein
MALVHYMFYLAACFTDLAVAPTTQNTTTTIKGTQSMTSDTSTVSTADNVVIIFYLLVIGMFVVGCFAVKWFCSILMSITKYDLKIVVTAEKVVSTTGHRITLVDYLGVGFRGSRGTLQSKILPRPRGLSGSLHCMALVPNCVIFCFVMVAFDVFGMLMLSVHDNDISLQEHNQLPSNHSTELPLYMINYSQYNDSYTHNSRKLTAHSEHSTLFSVYSISRLFTFVQSYRYLFVYLIPVWLSYLVILAMMNRSGNSGMEMFGHCTTKVPPRWDPSFEADYDYQTWEKDVTLWIHTTELTPQQIGPAIVLNLGGEARALARELDQNIVVNGVVTGRDPQTGQQLRREGHACLLEELRNRFGTLVQEQQIASISEFFHFRRKPNESIDEAITRFDITRGRARRDAGLTINEPGVAWIILNSLRVNSAMWPLLLAPFNGNLPSDANELRVFIAYIRQNCHLVEKQSDSRKTINQPYYTHEGESQNAYWMDEDEDDDDDEDESSCASNDDEEVYLDDVLHMSHNAACETVYLQYRTAKRRWRKLNPYSGRRFRKGKGKRFRGGFRRPYRPSFGKRFGLGKGHFQAQIQEDSQQIYFRKNPKGPDGQPLKCSICNSEEHLRARCPSRGSKGTKGSHKGGPKGSKSKSTFYDFSGYEEWDQTWEEEEEPLPTTSQSLPGKSQRTTASTARSSSSGASSGSATWTGFSLPHAQDTSSNNSMFHVFFAHVYGWWYHADVHLPQSDREGILVDAGAIDNLMSDTYFNRFCRLLSQYGKKTPKTSDLSRNLTVDGVGVGSNTCVKSATLPVHLSDHTEGTLEAPIVQDSKIPALWGLRSLQSKRALIDVYNKRIFFVGTQGYKIETSPDTRMYHLEEAKSGHLLLPVTEWTCDR